MTRRTVAAAWETQLRNAGRTDLVPVKRLPQPQPIPWQQKQVVVVATWSRQDAIIHWYGRKRIRLGNDAHRVLVGATDPIQIRNHQFWVTGEPVFVRTIMYRLLPGMPDLQPPRRRMIRPRTALIVAGVLLCAVLVWQVLVAIGAAVAWVGANGDTIVGFVVMVVVLVVLAIGATVGKASGCCR